MLRDFGGGGNRLCCALVLFICQHEGQACKGDQAGNKSGDESQLKEGGAYGGDGDKYCGDDKEQLLGHCKYLQNYFNVLALRAAGCPSKGVFSFWR